jgi:hypothetical protein
MKPIERLFQIFEGGVILFCQSLLAGVPLCGIYLCYSC